MSGDARRFLTQFLAAPRSVGALLPSSPALARAMLAPIPTDQSVTIVEFGPGTGPFTGEIARKISASSKYIGIELNPEFHRLLTARFPTFDFAQGSVADLRAIMATRGVTQIDAIVCGLPWASLPVALQSSVFDAIGDLLAPDGAFMTFAYVQGLALPGARALRVSLRARFANVTSSPIVWRNLPPALVYYCRGLRAA